MVRELLFSVHNANHFETLHKIFHSDSTSIFSKVAEKMQAVYDVLKKEEHLIRVLNYEKLLEALKMKEFFTKHDELKLRKNNKEVKCIIEILKEKDFEHFVIFKSCLQELKQSDAIFYPDKFKIYLQKRYICSSFIKTSHVHLSLPISEKLNIALIEISEEVHNEQSTFFDYHSLLLQQKGSYVRTPLESYSDIVIENCRVILIQGYPGSGKTFLAKRMCIKWANGKLLQSFTYVIFLPLRDARLVKSETFVEMLKLYIKGSTENTIDKIYETGGKSILIILEGWDELPENRRKDSLFTRLISGEILPEAVIVITSRPSAIRSLEFKHIERRIEILGFTEQQVLQNITHYFQNAKAPELIKQFKSELKRLPLLKCSVFVPINLCVALYIFKKGGNKLPETFTGMYTN